MTERRAADDGRSKRRWVGLAIPTAATSTAAQAAGENYDVAMGFFLALCLYLLFMFYIIPALVAWDRGHPATGTIWAITLLLGWTGIGWILALIWAFNSRSAVKGQAAGSLR
jgi:hypothetical protein